MGGRYNLIYRRNSWFKRILHINPHTFATLQLAEGTDIYTVSKLLTHSNLATTQVYADVVDELKRDAAERISLKIPTKEESDQT